MPIYLNREEEIKGKAPLEFYGDGQNLKDWEIQGKTSGNLYPIKIGEDIFFGNNGGIVHNVDGELVVEMGTQIGSGAYTYVTNESTLLRVHNELEHGSWSVEIKADTDFTLEIGFREDGRRNVSVTDEYQRFTFNNIRFMTCKSFTIYNRTGVAHTVYLRNFMFNLGSTALPYEPYGGVGDWDETEQKYKIPVRVEGENLFDTSVYTNDNYRHNCTVTNTSNSVTITSTGTDPYCGDVFTAGTTIPAVARTMYMSVKPNTAYTIAMSSAPKCYITQIDAEHNSVSGFRITQNLFTFTTNSATRYILIRLGDDTLQAGESRTFENIQLLEGTYTSSAVPPYEVDIYVDNQLLDGDSISLSSTQLNIPTLNNYNILTVPTQVQPSNITLTLPQTETEITKILGPLINPRYDVTDAYFGNLQVFTVWDIYTGQLPTTLYTTDWGLVDYKIYGTADGAGIKTKNLYNYNASGAVSLNLYPSEENGKLLSGQNNVSIIFEVKPDTVYSIYKLSTTRFRWACYAAAPQEGDEATSFSSSVSNTDIRLTFVTDSNAAYVVVFIKASSDSVDRDVLLRSVVVVEGPLAARDVPYGYKIPMRSQNSVVDIYIGDTPLGENEYVSYSDQKIYKYINGVLTPTDPPKELPTITTINGNTTIDTTLEEKQYITSDNKVYCVKNGGRYLLKGSGLRPDNFYSKYRKGGT